MIVKLKPCLKSFIWGGTKLKSDYGKSGESVIAESWELSCNKQGLSIIDSGDFKGETLADVLKNADLGKTGGRFGFFPVLNKFIDARENLSVQVHPNDAFALQYEGQCGKTEMWHILDADKDAFIYLGTNRKLSADFFLKAAENGSITDCLNKVRVRRGDTYFVPAGTLHAIGAGVTLFEVQQNSTLTYRVYDYGRCGKDGLRPLHIQKALQVSNLDRFAVPQPHRSELLGKCEYFSVYRYIGGKKFCFADSFCSLTVTDGKITAGELVLNKGETAFVSAGEAFSVSGNGEYIITCVE